MKMSLNEKIVKSRLLLRNPYAYLDEFGGYSALPLHNEKAEVSSAVISSDRKRLEDPYAHLDESGNFSALSIQSIGRLDGVNTQEEITTEQCHSFAEIERHVKKLHKAIWQNRNKIWAGAIPSNAIDMLDPFIALKFSGYDCDLEETLGRFYSDGKLVEVAGTLDRNSAKVRISRRFESNVQNFVAAHELGHVILHQTNGLHRDRPLDGTSRRSHTPRELEADKFATFFLMPEKLTKATFKKFFLAECFSLTEETSYALGLGDLALLREKIQSLRQLSRMIASAEQYNGVHFKSLANQFRVSTEAMAIRLEELGLVAI